MALAATVGACVGSPIKWFASGASGCRGVIVEAWSHGPASTTFGPAPTACSQDLPWLRHRERTSLVKNRMLEICTSGTVRGGAGNDPTYSACDRRSPGKENGM